MKDCSKVLSSVVQLTGRAGWTVAAGNWPALSGGMVEDLEVDKALASGTGHLASGIYGILASGIWQFYWNNLCLVHSRPQMLGGPGGEQVLEGQWLAVVG